VKIQPESISSGSDARSGAALSVFDLYSRIMALRDSIESELKAPFGAQEE
jgi:hypothetical protein